VAISAHSKGPLQEKPRSFPPGLCQLLIRRTELPVALGADQQAQLVGHIEVWIAAGDTLGPSLTRRSWPASRGPGVSRGRPNPCCRSSCGPQGT